jgi:hypothetical protein
MGLYLDVPYVSQLNYGGGMNDYTGCWYCSACMLGYYFEAGPRLGVPEIHTGSLTAEQRAALASVLGTTSGHAATGSAQSAAMMAVAGGGRSEHDLLAAREGLVPVADCAAAHTYTPAELEATLRAYGPVFFYWMKTHGGSTYGHASVVVGVCESSRTIAYHDPETGSGNSAMKLATFNAKRQRWKYALMHKNVTSHTPKTGGRARAGAISEPGRGRSGAVVIGGARGRSGAIG